MHTHAISCRVIIHHNPGYHRGLSYSKSCVKSRARETLDNGGIGGHERRHKSAQVGRLLVCEDQPRPSTSRTGLRPSGLATSSVTGGWTPTLACDRAPRGRARGLFLIDDGRGRRAVKNLPAFPPYACVWRSNAARTLAKPPRKEPFYGEQSPHSARCAYHVGPRSVLVTLVTLASCAL